MKNFAEEYLSFLRNLKWPEKPPEVTVLNPFADATAWKLTEAFYRKFYSDTGKRTLIIGINPGRFGGGVTGIPFTDPIRLAVDCQIPNELQKKPELSSNFIYQMITALGGPANFYGRYLFTAVSPVGFTMAGKNLNYYDHPDLKGDAWQKFMVSCFEQQIEIGAETGCAFVLGQGENLKFLEKLNSEHRFFSELRVLPHPRWVMQYRLKRLTEYIEVYRQALSA